MAEIVLDSYRLSVESEANRAYYETRPVPWVRCECAGCRNFVKAAGALPGAVRVFFSTLGLRPEQPAEIYAIEQEEGADFCLYGGFYHLCGKILSGGPWEEGLPEAAWVEIAPKYFAAFERGCSLLPGDFPRECFQMAVEFRLPWLLEEQNPYYSRRT